jgi:hypothetical protein
MPTDRIDITSPSILSQVSAVLLRALLQIGRLWEHDFDWLAKDGVAQDKFAF